MKHILILWMALALALGAQAAVTNTPVFATNAPRSMTIDSQGMAMGAKYIGSTNGYLANAKWDGSVFKYAETGNAWWFSLGNGTGPATLYYANPGVKDATISWLWAFDSAAVTGLAANGFTANNWMSAGAGVSGNSVLVGTNWVRITNGPAWRLTGGYGTTNMSIEVGESNAPMSAIAWRPYGFRQSAHFADMPSDQVLTKDDVERRGAISVVDYGAVGDRTTDDTSSLQAAFNVGGSIFIPPGTYRFTSQLIVSNRCTLTGSGYIEDETGAGSTVLLKDGDFDGVLVYGGAAVLEKFIVSSTNDIAGDGIVVSTPQVVVRDVSVIKQGGDGIRVGVKTAIAGNANMWRLANVIVRSNAGWGVKLDCLSVGGPNANAGLASGVFAFNNGVGGIYMDRAQVNTLSGINSEGNTGVGIYFTTNATFNSLLGYHCEANTGNEVEFAGGCYNNLVVSSDNSLVVDNGYNCVIASAGGVSQHLQSTRSIVVGDGYANRRGLAKSFGVEGATPGTWTYNTSAGVDEKLWSWVASSGTMILQAVSDNAGTANAAMLFYRNAANPSYALVASDLKVSTNLYVGGTSNRRDLSRHITVEGDIPGVVLYNTAGSADEKMWSMVSAADYFALQSVSDDAGTAVSALQFTRSGSALTAGHIYVPSLSVSGAVFPGDTDAGIFSGTNAPEGSVSANAGSLYLKSDGTGGNDPWFKASGSESNGWQVLVSGIHASATWNIGTVTNGGITYQTIAVTGAQLGDAVIAGHTSLTNAGWILSGVVSSVDNVWVTAKNETGAEETPASGTVNVTLLRQP
jgi:hypothetical protein